MADNVILFTDPNIYDGWSVKYFPDTDTFEWRDAHWTEKLDADFRYEWEEKHRKQIKKSLNQ